MVTKDEKRAQCLHYLDYLEDENKKIESKMRSVLQEKKNASEMLQALQMDVKKNAAELKQFMINKNKMEFGITELEMRSESIIEENKALERKILEEKLEIAKVCCNIVFYTILFNFHN